MNVFYLRRKRGREIGQNGILYTNQNIFETIAYSTSNFETQTMDNSLAIHLQTGDTMKIIQNIQY